MAHHKRRRHKTRRAGCLYCKPHKGLRVRKRKFNRVSGDMTGHTRQEHRAVLREREQVNEALG